MAQNDQSNRQNQNQQGLSDLHGHQGRDQLGRTPDPSVQPEQEGGAERQVGGDRSGAQGTGSQQDHGSAAGNQQTGKRSS
jgi:hypothetical protein